MEEQFLCIDLEMSGTIPGTHDIIQIAAVLLNKDFEVISEFDSLVHPENEADFDFESKRIHGISRFELNEAPSFEEMIDQLEDWLEEAGGYSSRRAMAQLKICGQGINNDICFLKTAYQSINMAWPFAHQFIDLQDIALFYNRILKANDMKTSKGVSLNATAKLLNKKRSRKKHDALEDALLTAQCFQELFKRAKEIKLTD